MRSAASTRTTRDSAGSDETEVLAEYPVSQLRHGPGQLDSGRAAAHDDDRHETGSFVGVRFVLGPLEG